MELKKFNINFKLMVFSQIISILGSAMLRFALNLHVLDVTGRADIFAIVIAISAVPGIFLSPINGAIADRVNRRNLMVMFDLMNSAIVAVLIFLLWSGNASVLIIGIVLALLGMIMGAYQPTVQASTPVLVDEEHLAGANGIVGAVGAVSGLLGPALGGALYGFIGIKILISISCIAFFLAAIINMFLKIPFKKPEKNGKMISSIMKDMKSGFHFVIKKKPYIFKIIVMAAAINLLMSPFFVIGTPYVLRMIMRSSDIMYGIGMALAELSTIVGALSVGYFAKKMKMEKLYRWLIFGAALLIPMSVAVIPSFLRIGYWPSFVIYFIPTIINLAMMTMISIYAVTTIQKETPNEMLGKVMSIIIAVSQSAAPLGQVLYGILFETFNSYEYITVFITLVITLCMSMAAKNILDKPEVV